MLKLIKYVKNAWVMAMAYDVSKRAFDERQKAKRKCKHCGHTQLLGLQDKAICDWCKHWIYKDDRVEFMYKLKEVRKCK